MAFSALQISIRVILVFQLCSSNVYGEKNITIGVMISKTGPKRVGREAEVAISLSLQTLNASPDFQYARDQGYQFHVLLDNVPCEPSDAFAEMLDIFSRSGDHVHTLIQDAFVGPSCDEVCQPGGRLAKYYDVMMISYGCESSIFDDKKEFPTFGRTTPKFKDMEIFFTDVIRHYKWPRVTLVTRTTPVWQETLTEFEKMISDQNVTVRRWSLESLEIIFTDEFAEQLREEAKETRVYILLMYSDAVVEFMRTAASEGLMNGENAFLAVDYAGTNQTATIGNATFLNGMLDVTYDVQPESQGFQEFLTHILNESEIGVDSQCSNYQYGIHPLLISDGIFVIAGAFNQSIAMGIPLTNGAAMANLTHGSRTRGLLHDIAMDETGTREAKFMLHNIQHGCYVPIARTGPTGRGLTFLPNELIWPGGTKVAPLGRDHCGWNNEYCSSKDNSLQIITGSAVGSILLVFSMLIGILSYLMWRKNVKQSRLLSTDWLKEWDEIKWRVVDPFSNTDSSVLNLNASSESLDSYKSDIYGNTLYSAPSTMSFRCPVVRMDVEGIWALKYIGKSSVQLTETVKRELNLVRSLKHPNINPFMGACVKPGHLCVMWMYSPKGSLMDLIHSGIFKMELMFQLSFAQDIAKGLAYLHNSDLRVHGRLKSSNIVVDSGLNCKLTDIDMPKFREGENDLSDTDSSYWFQKIWTCPERLRDPTIPASQKGDIYSYGIVLYEIMLKRKPYVTEEHLRSGTEPDWKEVIECVKDPSKYSVSHMVNNSIFTITEDEYSSSRNESPRPTSTHTYQRKSERRGNTRNLVEGYSSLHKGHSLKLNRLPDSEISNTKFSSSNRNLSLSPVPGSDPCVPHLTLIPHSHNQKLSLSPRRFGSNRDNSDLPQHEHYQFQRAQSQIGQYRYEQQLQQRLGNNPEQQECLLESPSPRMDRHSSRIDDKSTIEHQFRNKPLNGRDKLNMIDSQLPQEQTTSRPDGRHRNVRSPFPQRLGSEKSPSRHDQLFSTHRARSLIQPRTLNTDIRYYAAICDDGRQKHQKASPTCEHYEPGYNQSEDIAAVHFKNVQNSKSLSVQDILDSTTTETKSDDGLLSLCCPVCRLKPTSSKSRDPDTINNMSGNLQDRSAEDATSPTHVNTSVLRPEVPRIQRFRNFPRGSYDIGGSRRSTDSTFSREISRSSFSLNRSPRTDKSMENEVKVVQLMKHCWSENPESRPSSDTIMKKFRNLTSGRSLSDNIEQIMTRYSEQLEETVSERTQKLEEEKAKYFRVLCEVIPQKFVSALVSGEEVEAESFSSVTIFFSDIVGFTSICGKCSPQEVLDFLNELYTRFDVVLNSYNVYKVETIGDAYMVAAGIPEPIPDHAQQIAYMALHLLSVSVDVKAPHVDELGNRTTQPLQLRIGLNSGPVVAGIVGEKMPRYCLYGNTVNIASRMESNGKPLRIHMSKETTKELEDIGGFEISYRGLIKVKGKDKPVPTYWLLNSKLHPFDLPEWNSSDED